MHFVPSRTQGEIVTASIQEAICTPRRYCLLLLATDLFPTRVSLSRYHLGSNMKETYVRFH
jgi:hypothetical protein